MFTKNEVLNGLVQKDYFGETIRYKNLIEENAFDFLYSLCQLSSPDGLGSELRSAETNH